MVRATRDWTQDLERWLRPFLDRLGHKTRRRMCPVYVSGLIGPGDRKSIQPMAERLALGSYDRLHHFISSGVWDAVPVEAELLVQADKLVGGRDAVLVIDDTAILKKGIAAGVRFGCVLTDTAYGQSASFRQGLTDRELSWAVGIPRHLKVYSADVKMIRPTTRRGRPRQPIPHVVSRSAEDVLGKAPWRKVSWRLGTKGKLKARFAALRVRVADGPPQRIRDKGKQHLPGEEVWLVGEHRTTGEKKYYLANLPTQTDLRTLAATIKARWVCEQAHQQLKEEIGLDHFEGRCWRGLHRHALMTMIAYAFLQHRRLAAAKRKKKNQRPTTPANSACRTPGHSRPVRPATAASLSTLPKIDMQRAAA